MEHRPRKTDQALNRQFLELFKEQVERELAEIRQVVDRHASDAAKSDASIKNYIATVEKRINKKLDDLDEGFRGNGRIGVFEQLRRLRTLVAVLAMLTAFNLGFEMFGVRLRDWAAEKLGLDTPAYVAQEVAPKPNNEAQ